MNAISAIAKMQKLMRLKHYSLKTEETFDEPWSDFGSTHYIDFWLPKAETPSEPANDTAQTPPDSGTKNL